MKYIKVIFSLLLVCILAGTVYCTGVPENSITTEPTNNSDNTGISDYVPGIVTLQSYSSARPAIIFVVNHAGQGVNEEITERIIRLFAENNASLSLALLPFIGEKDTYRVKSFQYYVEAGIADVNVDYDRICLDDTNASCPGMNYEVLVARLAKLNDGFMEYYGDVPEACVLGEGLFCEDTYRALEASGFKVVTSAVQDDRMTSVQFTDYTGNADAAGLVRLPFTGNVCARDAIGNGWGDVYAAEADNDLFRAVRESLDENRIAVMEITPEAFAAGGGEVDEGKIGKLAEIIQYSRELGEITTYTSWYAYMDKFVYSPSFARAKDTPAYDGSPAIIFRMDDVAKDWYEDTTEEIIKIFQKHNIPLAVGVIPYLDGQPTFDIAMIKKYVNEGVIDLHMHGFDWTYAQMDTKQSGLTYQELIKGLKNGKQQMKNYYGFEPVTLSVPYDYYDETGYKAINDAGFKVFSAYVGEEPYPSTIPVDFNGKPDKNGMYRIPRCADVCVWDPEIQDWGKVQNIDEFRDLEYFAPSTMYNMERDYSYLPFYHDFNNMIGQLDMTGVAVISIHPDAFVTPNGETDWEGMKKLEDIVNWARQLATITTFDKWYKYQSSLIDEPEL
jgi:peptidoglycan/xylan/chitin deacetylase (PgdA/CDA1 family)